MLNVIIFLILILILDVTIGTGRLFNQPFFLKSLVFFSSIEGKQYTPALAENMNTVPSKPLPPFGLNFNPQDPPNPFSSGPPESVIWGQLGPTPNQLFENQNLQTLFFQGDELAFFWKCYF